MPYFPQIIEHVISSNWLQKIGTLLFKKIRKAFGVWRVSVCNLAGTWVTKWHLGSKIQKIGPNPEDRPPKIKNFRPKNFSKNRILNFQYLG